MNAEEYQEVVKSVEDSGIRIRKVKVQKGRVTINYQESSPAGGWTDCAISSHEQPRPQLPVALGRMADHVIETCELQEGDLDRIQVHGVSIGYHMSNDQDQRSIVITATRKLHQSLAPMVINTPAKKEEVDGKKEDPRTAMTIECNQDMVVVMAEAIRYINGERQQERLDLGGGAPPEVPEEASNVIPIKKRKVKTRDGSTAEVG